MKEKLYTIPVNDAFQAGDECPVCRMRALLEANAIEFTMGPSYMEDDVRMETDRIGFCRHHIRLLYANQNRLGLALMLKTHMDRTISDLERLAAGKTSSEPSARPASKPSTAAPTSASKPSPFAAFLHRKGQSAGTGGNDPIQSYIQGLDNSCYVCSRIGEMYGRYLDTVFYLYKNDSAFRSLFQSSKGFCTSHYALLRGMAPEQLSGAVLAGFLSDLDKIYIENMKRVRDDLEWFTDKFDYRNADAPWKNSKDALPRAITKTNSIVDEFN